MDFTQLRTLIHVAELGSLSKAADRLNIAQPALSRQVRLLEAELGIVLFERHGRGMVISDVGKRIVERAAEVMQSLDEIRAIAASERNELRGTVSIGTTPTVAEIMTVHLAKRLKEAHPRLHVRFSSAFSGHLIDWLQRGELDVAVVYDTDPLKSLRVIPVMMEDLFMVSGDPERLSADRSVSFARLAAEELVLPSPRHGLRTILDECARKAGVTLTASVETDSFSVMIDLVRNNFGSTVLPLAPIFSLVQLKALSAAPLIDPAPVRRLVLAYPSDRPTLPAARLVGTVFRQVARELVEQGIWSGRLL